MRNTDTFRQYIWLINTLQRAKKMSLKSIQERWIDDDLNSGQPLTRSTFIRIKAAVEDMFGILIHCDRKDGNLYYIGNPETFKDNTTQNWMLQTLTVNNVLIDSLSIKDRLVLEEIPEGLEYLQTIIKAIKNNLILEMTHQSFDSPAPKTITIEPYCLKVFRQRWYILVKSDQHPNELRIYALDRITKLEETNQTFVMDPDFNACNFFKHYFGVFVSEKEKPVHIVLRAHGNKMISLLRTLPKHQSQKEIITEIDFSDFEYYLAPTLDFKHEILKEGADLEVLEPQSLRKEIKTKILSSLEHYQTR